MHFPVFAKNFRRPWMKLKIFFCQFPNPWALRVSGMGGYTSKCEKKSKSLHPTDQSRLSWVQYIAFTQELDSFQCFQLIWGKSKVFGPRHIATLWAGHAAGVVICQRQISVWAVANFRKIAHIAASNILFQRNIGTTDTIECTQWLPSPYILSIKLP